MVFGRYQQLKMQETLTSFQFPVGIRWCSDLEAEAVKKEDINFQFPVGIRWCSDGRLFRALL